MQLSPEGKERMDKRVISEEYAEIGEELIKNEEILSDITDNEISVIFLSSDLEKKSKGSRILGQCEKIPEKYKWGIPCDFTVTLFEPNIVGMSLEQIKILILHELMHIGVDGDKLYCKNHDITDFKCIIDKYGTDWSEVKNG